MLARLKTDNQSLVTQNSSLTLFWWPRVARKRNVRAFLNYFPTTILSVDPILRPVALPVASFKNRDLESRQNLFDSNPKYLVFCVVFPARVLQHFLERAFLFDQRQLVYIPQVCNPLEIFEQYMNLLVCNPVCFIKCFLELKFWKSKIYC